MRGNIAQLMQQAQKMQENLQRAQEELANLEVTGSAGGGMVSVTLTGTKECRDEFQRLLADCRSGHIDLILTKSISRFARNTVTLLETVRELKLLEVDVFFEEQSIHTISAEGELMMTILASYAQEESLSASENQKWRIRKDLRLNVGLYNLTDKKVWRWSDVRGLAASSPVIDSYTQPGRSAKITLVAEF